MYPQWLRLAWTNRERLFAVARKVPPKAWGCLAVVAAIAWLVYLAPERWGPAAWPWASWAIIAINVVGWAMIVGMEIVRFRREDEVWVDVEALRAEVEDLRAELQRPVPAGESFERREIGGRVFTFVAAPE